jgi:hypothetical protein
MLGALNLQENYLHISPTFLLHHVGFFFVCLFFIFCISYVFVKQKNTQNDMNV